MMIDNEIMYQPVAWGAWDAGLYVTPVSTRLTASEVADLVEDSGSRIVIASPAHEGLIAEIKPGLPQVAHWILTGPGAGGTPSLRVLIASEAELAVGPTDDRKSVVYGKSVSESVDHGGSRFTKNKQTKSKKALG